MRLRLFVERSYPAINSLACAAADPQILIEQRRESVNWKKFHSFMGILFAANAKEISPFENISKHRPQLLSIDSMRKL